MKDLVLARRFHGISKEKGTRQNYQSMATRDNTTVKAMLMRPVLPRWSVAPEKLQPSPPKLWMRNTSVKFF